MQPSRAAREPYHVRHQRPGDDTDPGTSPYQVQDTCTCPDAAYREADHAGMCKHVALRVLLVIAQLGVGRLKHLIEALRAAAGQPAPIAAPPEAPALTPAPTPEQDTFAFVELDALLLAGALFFVRTANQPLPAPIQIAAQAGQIALSIADRGHLVRLAGQDGAGDCVTRIDPEPFELIWEHARALSRALKHQPVQLFVSPGDVVICAPGSDPEETGGVFTLTGAAVALAAPAH